MSWLGNIFTGLGDTVGGWFGYDTLGTDVGNWFGDLGDTLGLNEQGTVPADEAQNPLAGYNVGGAFPGDTTEGSTEPGNNAGGTLQQAVDILGKLPKDAITATGAGTAAGLLGYLGTTNTNAANAQQAALNREFQERMSSTAWQRGIADMTKAGINPLLAASKGGASTPGGAQAAFDNAIGAGLSSAKSGAETVTALRNAFKTGDQISATTTLTEAQADQTRADTALKILQAPYIKEQTHATAANAKHVNQLATNALATLESIQLENQYLRGSMGGRVQSATQAGRKLAAEAAASELDLTRAGVYSDWYKTGLGKEEPKLNLGIRGVSSAAQAIRSMRP